MSELTPPLKWHGGKHYLVPHLVKLASSVKHAHRVEAFAGGCQFMLAMPRDNTSEVVNDLHQHLTNFWRVLQDPETFGHFVRRCQATPFSEAEWKLGRDTVLSSAPQPIAAADGCASIPDDRAAWAFFVFCRQSMAGRMKGFAPTSKNRTRRGMNEQVSAWLSAVEGLQPVHERVIRWFVMNTDAKTCVKRNDGPKTLTYLDPPYHPATRTAPDVYHHEMSHEQHVELLDCVTDPKRQGYFILSHYPHPLYEEKLRNWKRVEFDLPNNAASGAQKERKTECVWYNFNVAMPDRIEAPDAQPSG